MTTRNPQGSLNSSLNPTVYPWVKHFSSSRGRDGTQNWGSKEGLNKGPNDAVKTYIFLPSFLQKKPKLEIGGNEA